MKRKIVLLFAIALLAVLCVGLCSCKDFNAESVILSCKDASADGYNIEMKVSSSTESVDLSKKIVAHLGLDWKVYSDKNLSRELDRTVTLRDGANVFYIAAVNALGSVSAVYTLTIVRNYKIIVTYDVNGTVFKTDESFVNQPYTVNESYVPQLYGYEFDYWADENGQRVTTITPDGFVWVYAKFKPSTYTATVNVNSKDVTSEVEYNSPFTLPVEADGAKLGYTFDGWSYNGQRLTDATGKSIGNWSILSNVTLTPIWTAKKFTLTATTNNTQYGTVSGAGKYSYNETATLTATTETGYTWIGWYANNSLVSDKLTYSFVMPSQDVTLEARWEKYFYTRKCENIFNNKTTSTEVITPAGQTLKLQAYCYEANIFLGWYVNGEKYSDEISMQFEMPKDDVIIVERWAKLSWSNEPDLGDINASQNVSKPGDTVTLTITPFLNYGTWNGWYGQDNVLLSKQTSYDVVIPNGNITLIARWDVYNVTLNCNDTAAGSVKLYRNGSEAGYFPAPVRAGVEVEARATTSQKEYIFEGWFENGEKICSNKTYVFDMQKSNRSLEARWLPYTVRTYYTDNSVNITVTDNYAIDKMITVKAERWYGQDDRVWYGWFNDDTLLTTDYEYAFEMPNENVRLGAKLTYNPTAVYQNDSRLGSVETTRDMIIGQPFDMTATPYVISSFDGWFDEDGQLLSAELTYHIDSLDDELRRITAKFTAKYGVLNFVFVADTTKFEIHGLTSDAQQLTEIFIPIETTLLSERAFYFYNTPTVFRYEGTIEQFSNLEKGAYWRPPRSVTIICSDGEYEY